MRADGRLRRAGAVVRDPGVLGVLAFGLICCLVPLGGIGDEVFRLRFVWFVQVPMDVLFTYFAWRASRVPGVERVVRQMMLAGTAAGVLFVIGDSWQAVRMLVRPALSEIDGGPAQTVFYVTGCGVLVLRMLTHPAPGSTRGERLRFHLDALAVLISGGVLAWCFSIDPVQGTPVAAVGTVVAVAIVLVTAFAAVKLVLSGTAPLTLSAAVPMVAAAGCLGLSMFLAPLVDGGGLHPGIMVLRVLAPTLIAIGPRIQELQTVVRPRWHRDRKRRPYHVLPYAAVLVTFAVFLVMMPADIGPQAWGGVIGVVTITAVVVVRQLLAFLDNFDLINRLDVTLLELRGQERMLHEQATRDGLTGLANRTAFTEAVAVDLGDRRAAHGLAVLLIDLDDFKTVNDTLGHGVGDGLLITVAERLRGAVRAKDLVSRLGGDEFAVLLRGVTAEEAGAMAGRILADVVQPARVGGHSLVVKASIGVAPARAGDDVEGLLRNADIAMYAAKDAGKGGVQQYDAGMGARILETAELGNRLRDAIGTDQFRLVYQPVVEMDTGAVLGAEALVRWHPPGRDPIPPGDFIPTAESTGEIVPLGRWILGEAVRQLASWRREHPAAADLRMSVNVSGRQLQVPSFAGEVAAILAEHGVPADRIVIEITETAVLDHPAALDALHGLRALGLDLALDDFGTAASSLGLLLTCPMSSLKLDRSFVDRLGVDSRPAAVANAVSQIARALSLGTVAEGVESAEQAAILRGLGYTKAQGYFYSHPLPPADFAAQWTEVVAQSAI